jgi:hypothetical protein
MRALAAFYAEAAPDPQFRADNEERIWMKRLDSRLAWWHKLPPQEPIAVNAAERRG